MEKGFYHSDIGYWQTVSEPSQEILDSYPDGTVEVPLKPGADYEWKNKKWVHVPPPEPTPEELRAQMPPLTRRQFWLGANSLGLSKADVIAATDDPVILIEIEESGEFHRTYESILMLSGVLGITPEQLDDVWMWWASA